MRPAPSTADLRPRSLLLRAGERDPEQIVVVSAHAERRLRRHGVQQRVNLAGGQWFAVDAIPAFRRHALGKKLDGADAVAADRLEQRERLGVLGPEAPAEALADAVVVGQQVVEPVRDDRAADLARAGDRQRQGQERTLSDCSQELA